MKKIITKYRNAPIELKAAFWFTVCSLMQKAISIITIPLFTRLLTTEEYGTYTIFISWSSILSIFATLNLSYYVFDKGMVKYEDDRDGFVLSLQMLGSVVCGILFIVYLLGHDFFNSWFDLPTSIMCLMFILFLFDPATKYWSARQRFEYKYHKLVIVTFAMTILNPLIGFCFVIIAKDRAFARILSVVLVMAVFGLLFYLQHIRKSNIRLVTKYWRYALSFNIPLIPHFLTSIILNNADRIMINDMCGKTYAAIYGVAYSAAMIMILINNALHQSILPWLYHKIKANDCNGVSGVFNGMLVLVAGANLLLIVFAPEVITIMAPESYHGAIWIVPPVAASVYFMFLYNLFANIEMYFEESKLITVTSVGVALLNIGLNYIFIVKYGYLAAGYTTIFCYVVFSIAHYYMMKCVCKKHKFSEPIFNIKWIIVLSVGFLLFTAMMLVLYSHVVLRYLFIIAIVLVEVVNKKHIIALIATIKKG